MPTVYDFIYVEDTPAMELTNDQDKAQAMQIGSKLAALEPEILQHPEGRITVRKSGIVFVDSFPREVADKINKAL